MNDLAWLFWTAGGLLAAGGAALLAWSLLWDRPRGRKRCPKCWYDMSGTASGPSGLRCPECGRIIGHPKRLVRTRRRWRWALAGVLLLAAGGVSGAWPNARRDGWASFVPIAVLGFVADRFPNESERLHASLSTRSPTLAPLRTWERVLLARACRVRLDRLLPLLDDDPGNARLCRDAAAEFQCGLLTKRESRIMLAPIAHVLERSNQDYGYWRVVMTELACAAAVECGPAGESLRGPIIEYLRRGRNGKFHGGKAGVAALVSVDPSGEVAAPFLMAFYRTSQNPDEAAAAIRGLAEYAGRSTELDTTLTQGLRDTRPVYDFSGCSRVRDVALDALEKKGNRARSFIPFLESLARQSPDFAARVELALPALRGQAPSARAAAPRSGPSPNTPSR